MPVTIGTEDWNWTNRIGAALRFWQDELDEAHLRFQTCDGKFWMTDELASEDYGPFDELYEAIECAARVIEKRKPEEPPCP